MALLMGILFLILVLFMLGGDTKEKVLDEYCNLECKKNIKKAPEFCC